jgi:hypothetical protein
LFVVQIGLDTALEQRLEHPNLHRSKARTARQHERSPDATV